MSNKILYERIEKLERLVDYLAVDKNNLKEENLDLQRQVDAITKNVNVIFDRLENINDEFEQLANIVDDIQ